MPTNLDADIAASNEYIMVVWEFGALHALSDPLVWSSTQIIESIKAALANDLNVIPGPVSVVQGNSGDWFAGATLRIPKQSDGLPYSAILGALQFITIGLESASLIQADYADPGEDPTVTLAALAGTDMGPIGNTVAALQATINQIRQELPSNTTVEAVGAVLLGVVVLVALGYSGIIKRS